MDTELRTPTPPAPAPAHDHLVLILRVAQPLAHQFYVTQCQAERWQPKGAVEQVLGS